MNKLNQANDTGMGVILRHSRILLLAAIQLLSIGAANQALASADCTFDQQSCTQRCIRNGSGTDCMSRCNSLAVACGRSASSPGFGANGKTGRPADPDVNPPSGSQYVPGKSSSSNTTTTQSQPKGHWVTKSYRASFAGSDRLMIDSYLEAWVVNSKGDLAPEGGYLDVHNLSEKYSGTFVITDGPGTVVLAPGERRHLYLPIYRSKNDTQPTVVQFTAKYWVED